jgi:hypothetical protein
MKIAEVRKLYRQLNEFGAQAFELTRRICAEPEEARKWMAAESELANMDDVLDALENISWEAKADELYRLSTDAEDERNELRVRCNEFRQRFGVNLEQEDV